MQEINESCFMIQVLKCLMSDPDRLDFSLKRKKLIINEKKVGIEHSSASVLFGVAGTFKGFILDAMQGRKVGPDSGSSCRKWRL